MKKYLILFALFLYLPIVNAGADWDTETELKVIHSLSHTADGADRYHPEDGGHNDDNSLYISASDPIEVSYFRIERKTAGVITCEKLVMWFIASEDLTNVVTTVEPYSTAIAPDDVSDDWNFITSLTKDHGTTDKDGHIKIKDSNYHEFDDDEGIFLGPNHVYKVTVTYKLDGVSGVRVFWIEEDTSSGSSQRINIIYDSSATASTLFADAGYATTDANTVNYSNQTVEPPEEKEKKFFDNIIACIAVNFFIGFVFIKIGSLVFTGFQTPMPQFAGLLMIYAGIMSFAVAIEGTIGLITGNYFISTLLGDTGGGTSFTNILLDVSFSPGATLIEAATGVDINPLW